MCRTSTRPTLNRPPPLHVCMSIHSEQGMSGSILCSGAGSQRPCCQDRVHVSGPIPGICDAVLQLYDGKEMPAVPVIRKGYSHAHCSQP